MKTFIKIILICSFCLLILGKANAQVSNKWIIDSRNNNFVLDFSLDNPIINKISYNHGTINSICNSRGDLKYFISYGIYGINPYRTISEFNKNPYLTNSQLARRSIIIPEINNNGIYYFFTISSYKSLIPGLFYSELNKNSNSGLGEITILNNEIERGSFSYLTSQIFNKETYWVIAYNYPDYFYAIKLSENGIDTIIRNTRTRVKEFDNYIPYQFHETRGIWGFLKLSHDCKSLVETINISSNDSSRHYVIIHDFNPETGLISNQRIIKKYYGSVSNGFSVKELVLNSVFSPNDSLIYISNGKFGLHRLDRYDYKMDYDNSIIPGLKDTVLHAQLANNGRVYFYSHSSNGEYNISEIKYPDSTNNKYCYKKKVFSETFSWSDAYFPHVYFEDMRIIPKYSNTCNNTHFKVWYDTNVFKEIVWYFTKTDSARGILVTYDFEKSGIYPILLKAKKTNGYVRTHYDTIVYYNKPIANFYSDTNASCQWIAYQFYDSSFRDTVNNDVGESWLWDFGDGITDTIQNPAHVYTKSGRYTVKLVYCNGFCTDTIEKQQAVEIIAAPRPGFKMSQTNYCSPYLLQITDTSLGQVQSYFYEFGDGSDTNIASPNHYYENAGNYTIVQTLTGPTGCVTKDSAILHLTKGFSGNEQVNSLTANVLDNDSIILNWESMTDALSYNLFKSFNDPNYIRLIKLQDTFYTDLKVDPTQNVYAYKIAALDSCQRPTQNSLKLKNILLTGETHHNNYSILYWTPFEEWQNGVEEYYLQYQTESGQFAMVNTSSNTEYQDNRFFDGKTQWAKCYRIMAIEKDGNLQQSISNLLCLDYEAVLWIPTAFSPNRDGLNDSFLVQGIRIEDFNLQLFNRWGEKVFETTDPKIGWDGNFHQNPCAAGVYTYIIKATGNVGKQISLSGSLHLLR